MFEISNIFDRLNISSALFMSSSQISAVAPKLPTIAFPPFTSTNMFATDVGDFLA
jgi:hypothetical protein